MIELLLNQIETIGKELIVNKRDKKENTAFMLTVEYDDEKLWDLFFEKLKLNNSKNLIKTFDLPFFKKILQHNNYNFLKYLKNKLNSINIDQNILTQLLNRADENNMKIIHYAIIEFNKNNSKIIKFLLKNGCKITNTTKYIKKKQCKIIRLLSKKIAILLKIKNNNNKYIKINIVAKNWCERLCGKCDDKKILEILKNTHGTNI